MVIPAAYIHPFRESANRPQLWAGMERAVLLCNIYLSFVVIVSFMSRWGFIIGIGTFVFLGALGRYMAKIDPHMIEVYIGSLDYHEYYPARTMQARTVRILQYGF